MAQRVFIRDTVCQALVTQDTDLYLQAVAVDRKLRGNGVGSALMDVDAEVIEVDEVRLDLLRHDPATQTIKESHVSLSQAGVRLNPVVQRYAWPSEFDLVAQIVGLRRMGRRGGWDREPSNSGSSAHISIYGR